MADADDNDAPVKRDRAAERAARRAERRQAAAQRRPAKSQSGRQVERTGTRAFIRECWAELQRVQWPNRPQLLQATAVVIATCFVVGLYLYGLDSLFSRVAGWLINQQAG